jgi:hypothetical protein
MIIERTGAHASIGAKSASRAAGACTSALTVRVIMFHQGQAVATGGSKWERVEVGTKATERRT